MKSYVSIGVMSGTSLDGLDLVACRFTFDQSWNYEIIKTLTIPYSHKWITKLSTATELNALDFAFLNNDFGKFIGKQVAEFCADFSQKPDLVSSHGHTIFHQPKQRLTLQIGHGASLAAASGRHKNM